LAEEKKELSKSLTKEYFEIYLWPPHSKDIPDNIRLKLVVQQNRDEESCREILENCGERTRVRRNTVLFLCPMESERISFNNFLKEKLAWRLIEEDKTLSLTPEQKREAGNGIKKAEREAKERIRSLYRILLLPSKDGFKEINLGIPTYGAETSIDKEIYERLRSENEILEKLASLSLKEKYLKDRDYVETKNILESLFNTPGEIRITSDGVLKNCIKEGVEQGLFGVGDLEKEKPICRYFKTEFSPGLVEGEILIRAELYKPPEEGFKPTEEAIPFKETAEEEAEEKVYGKKESYRTIHLKLDVPTGKLSDIVRIIPYLKSKFNQVKVKVEIFTQGGEITISNYEDKIEETFKQANITIEEKKLNNSEQT
jgi:hypothetical protein